MVVSLSEKRGACTLVRPQTRDREKPSPQDKKAIHELGQKHTGWKDEPPMGVQTWE